MSFSSLPRPRFWQVRRLATSLLALLGASLFGQQPSASNGFDPNVNGIVNVAVTQSDGKVLLGGIFTTLQPNGAFETTDRTNLARVNSDGTLDASFSAGANGVIHAVALQADGKILIGGAFTVVNNEPRNRLARLNADGSLDFTFNPNVGGGLAPEVYAILIQPDGNIVLGGTFATVGAVTRNRLARLNGTTGALDASFDPNASGPVLSLGRQSTNGSLIVGGSFTKMGSTDRRYLARVSASGVLDEGFDPRPDNVVRAIVVQTDGAIVLGGNFSGLQPADASALTNRSRLVRLDANGAIDAFYDPGANGQVNALALQPDGRLLVGGNFTSFTTNGSSVATSRTYVARLNVDGTVDSSFQVTANGGIQTVSLQSDNRVVVGGYFTQLRVGSTTTPINRNHVGRLNADGTPDTTLDPAASGLVVAQAVQANKQVVVGGTFTIMGGLTRNYLARLNEDGTVDTAFSPAINGSVQAVAIQSDQKILIGGTFTNVGGVVRNYVARLEKDGTLDLTFNPQPDNQVATLAVQGDGKILIGGSFFSLQPNAVATNLVTRSYLARVNPDGIVDTSFNPEPNSAVNVITVLGDGKILIGGNFTGLNPNAAGGVSRPFSARLNSNGTVDVAYDPLPDAPVRAQAIQSDGKIIIGGSFTRVAPKGATAYTERYYIARYNADGTLDTAFNPHASAPVSALAIQADGKIILGGQFAFLRPNDDAAKTVDRFRLARLESNGTPDLSYNPNPNGQVIALTLLPTGKLLVSGGFSAIVPPTQGFVVTRNRIARINTDGTVDTGFDPSVTTNNGGLIGTLAIQPDGKLVVGGGFTNFSGAKSANLARFNANGDADALFVPSPDREVATVLVQPARDAIIQASTLAWFNRNSTLRPGFNHANVAQLAGQINAVLIQSDGKIILAGTFTNKIGSSANHLVRLNPDGSFDDSWKPTPAGSVNALALQSDGKLIIGGGFDSVNGTTRYRLARLNPDGTVDSGYDPNVGDTVYALAIQSDGKCLVGGAFTTFQPNGAAATTARNYLARLNTDGTLDTAYNPTPSAAVRALKIQPDGKLLVGGAFTSFVPNNAGVSTPRNFIARLNADGTIDTAFDPFANNLVYSITLQSDGNIIVGGAFTSFQPNLGTVSVRNYIARLNGTDGTVDANFNPSPNGTVYATALLPDGSVALGGSFTSLQPSAGLNSFSRSHLAIVGSDGALDAGFNPGPAGDIFAIAAPDDGTVIVGGSFASLASDTRMIVGGSFTTIGGAPIANLAQLDNDGNASPIFAPNPNGAVVVLAQQPDTKIILGGNFTNVAGLPRNRIARITTDGVLDAGYNPNIDGAVATVALQSDGKLVVGGAFTTVGGVARTNLARLNVDGTLDAGFTATANAQVSAILLRPDGKIVIAGSFTSVAGQPRSRLARLNTDGSLDAGFNPNANGDVVALIASVDGRILVGGTFTSIGGVTRNNVARLDANGVVESAFNPGADGSVLALAIQSDGSPVLGGAFNAVGGEARYRLARLSSGTTSATQTISATANRTALTWTRGGSAPELSSARFEFSTDAVTWSFLGSAVRLGATSNWQLGNLSNLPASTTFYVRALGITPTSKNASAGLVRSEQVFNFAVTPALSSGGTIGASTDQSFRYATADGTPAIYSAVGLPAGLSIDAATGVITGTPTQSGTFSITVTAANAGGNVSLTFTLSVGGAGGVAGGDSIRLINLSTRSLIAGNGTAITGFSSSGGSVLIRAVGPGLSEFGVSDALADPVLRIYNSAGVLVTESNDWNGAQVSAAAAATGAFPLVVGSKDSALLLDLPAGGYTAHAIDATGHGGVVLTEIYDADRATITPRFTNLSTRAPVEPGAPLIGGFVITAADGAGTQNVLIRGVGPGLAKFGVANALVDPVLKVYDATGALVATSDNWSGSDIAAAASASGAFALEENSKDAALLLTLEPGAYTFEITAAPGTAAGEALADLYAAP